MLARKFTQCFFTAAVISCSAPGGPSKHSDQPYFPLESGMYADFIVEKVRYTEGQPDQISKTLIRRLVSDPVQRTDGQMVFPIQYSSRKDGVFWQTDSITANWRTTDRLFELENGQPVIRIAFPVYEGATWNPNTFNTSPEGKFRAISMDKPYQIQAQLFPNTLTIIRQDDSTLLSRKKYIETYATDVGLIRREILNLQYCYAADCVGKGIIFSGLKEITTIKNFGKQ